MYGIAGTPVRSIAAGTVIQVYAFYKGTDAVEIRHEFGIVRYCEVKQIVVAAGQTVGRGQPIAAIGKMDGMSQMMGMMAINYGYGNLNLPQNKPSSAPEILLFGDRVHQGMSIAGDVIYSLEGKAISETGSPKPMAGRCQRKISP